MRPVLAHFSMCLRRSSFLYVISSISDLVAILTRFEKKEIPVLGQHIPQLAEFLLRCGGNRNYDAELRVLALNALNWTVQ